MKLIWYHRRRADVAKQLGFAFVSDEDAASLIESGHAKDGQSDHLKWPHIDYSEPQQKAKRRYKRRDIRAQDPSE